MKLMWMLIFGLLPLVAVAYIAWHIWTLLPLAGIWKCAVIIVGVCCFLTLFLDLSRRLDGYPLPLARTLYETGTSSLIVMLYLVMLFLLLDIGRLIRLVPKSFLYHNGVTAIGILALICGIFLYGNWRYRNKVRVPLEVRTTKKLPKTYKVVMASDLHLGYHNPRKELARWVDMMNAEQPDFILLAGDVIDISVRPLIEERMAEEFHRLNAPVYACLGNHEFYTGEPEAQQFYKDAGIHLLRDAAAEIDSSIVIIGRDDRANRRRKPIGDLASNVDKEKFIIALDHQPYHLEKVEKAGIDFQLSGHTHRGQVWPISWITDAIYECAWGSHQRGRTQYYVSSGLGIWGGKYRIGTQSEYVVATFTQGE